MGHSRSLFDGMLNLRAGYDIGLPVLGAKGDTTTARSAPRSEFRKVHVSGGWERPFDVGGRSASFSTQATAQWSPDTLYSSERLDLGGRHTVRGFQLDSVSGDSGGYVRNEISAAVVPKKAMPDGLAAALGEVRLYAGYDAGVILRDSDDDYERGVLQGSALGLRTSGGSLGADLCLSKPLDAPSFMHNRDWEVYWGLSINF
jgi:hemolysin activation/secretion protein